MVTSAAEVLGSRDSHGAAQLDGHDDTMDRLHQDLLTAVLAEDWIAGTGAAVDLTLLWRYYERFVDQAVEIGRRTILWRPANRPPPGSGDGAVGEGQHPSSETSVCSSESELASSGVTGRIEASRREQLLIGL